MSANAKKELTIVIAWHQETDERKIACFEENKRTFELSNPGVDIVVVYNPFHGQHVAWLSSDLSIFSWYDANKESINSKRFLLVEWDCWCDVDLKDYFRPVWDFDLIVPCVVYPERDLWNWFSGVPRLPARARPYATGMITFCGVLISDKAMAAINQEIHHPDYYGLNSELRFATIATMLGFHPIPNPVCGRINSWKNTSPFDTQIKGLHHPRKTLPDPDLFKNIEPFFNNSTPASIPKVIHQTWKSDVLSEDMQMLADTWKELHPDWDYVLWTDEMNREFIRRFYPDFLLQYDSYPQNIQRVDAVRYFILLKMGGVFIDIDFECLQNIEPLLQGRGCIFALEPAEHCAQFKKEKIICNAFMAARPREDFFNVVCNSLVGFERWNSDLINSILSTTGPFALTKIYDSYEQKQNVTLLPSSTVYPLTVKETRRAIADDVDSVMQAKIDEAYAVHYFFGTWYSNNFK